MSEIAEKKYSGMVVTDLDGTLNHPSGEYTSANRTALVELGRAGYLRVVATGRSLFFARKHVPVDFPVDYVIFSSGAGTVEWPTQQLLISHHLAEPDVEKIRRELVTRGHDFMIHDPIPENHHFAYHASGAENPDFQLRCHRQAQYGRPLTEAMTFALATQFLAVVGGQVAERTHRELRQALSGFNVIRATSPLDKESAWLEIFPRQVSKSSGASWLAKRHRLTAAHALAVGNDYNDWDLLQWAGTARVVADSPDSLRQAFSSVAAHHESGFAEAVSQWLKFH